MAKRIQFDNENAFSFNGKTISAAVGFGSKIVSSNITMEMGGSGPVAAYTGIHCYVELLKSAAATDSTIGVGLFAVPSEGGTPSTWPAPAGFAGYEHSAGWIQASYLMTVQEAVTGAASTTKITAVFWCPGYLEVAVGAWRAVGAGADEYTSQNSLFRRIVMVDE